MLLPNKPGRGHSDPALFLMEGQKCFLRKKSIRIRFQIITLTVKGEASSFVSGLKIAQVKISELNDESSECEQFNAARYFAKVIFGEEQANQLVDFYNDPLTVITACGMYFQDRLSKKITKAQKT